MALYGKKTLATIQHGIDTLTPFTVGNVAGRTDDSRGYGRLSTDLAANMRMHAREGTLEYVLYSYGTPMAWKVRDMENWVLPGVKYSVSTSCHQGVFRVAIANPGFYLNR